MINLLPPDLKASYNYARRNVKLRRWVLLCLIALVGLGMIGTYGLLKFEQSTKDYNQRIATAQANLKKEHFAETQAKVKDINNGFQLTVKVLSQEILFSKLIQQVATSLPSKTVLTGLNIPQVQGAVDITASAADYNTATQIQINLSDPSNKIFSKADIVSINCSGKPNPYPCLVTIRALFAADNPYLFINSQGVKP